MKAPTRLKPPGLPSSSKFPPEVGGTPRAQHVPAPGPATIGTWGPPGTSRACSKPRPSRAQDTATTRLGTAEPRLGTRLGTRLGAGEARATSWHTRPPPHAARRAHRRHRQSKTKHPAWNPEGLERALAEGVARTSLRRAAPPWSQARQRNVEHLSFRNSLPKNAI